MSCAKISSCIDYQESFGESARTLATSLPWHGGVARRFSLDTEDISSLRGQCTQDSAQVQNKLKSLGNVLSKRGGILYLIPYTMFAVFFDFSFYYYYCFFFASL